MGEKVNRKPLFVTLAALAGIIVITAAVTLILRVCGGVRFPVDDVPYPYAWVEKNVGTITLTMETGGAADGVWRAGSAEGDVVEINVGATRGGKTTAALHPVEAGRGTVTFLLMSGEEQLAELNLTISVESRRGKLAATVIAHRERVLQNVVRGGEETGHPFTVRGGDDGLTIFIQESEGYTDDGTAWMSESTDSLVAYASEINISDEGVTVHLETRANGRAEVTVYSVRDNISFVFDVESGSMGMLLTDFHTEAYAAEEDGETGEAETEADGEAGEAETEADGETGEAETEADGETGEAETEAEEAEAESEAQP